MDLIARHLHPRVLEALDTFRVVVIHGPRQCGKTTLARLIAEERDGSYVSLDDPETLRAARADPVSFLTSRPFPLVVDEIQLGGDRLIRAIKQLVDDDPARGRFLLSGSSNFLTVPTISESLAGRVRILHLWPFSEAEVRRTASTIVDGWFADPERIPRVHTSTYQFGLSSRRECLELLCRGGYPDVISLGHRERRGWFNTYVETVVQRDLKTLAKIRKAHAVPSLLNWASAVSGTHANTNEAAGQLGMNRGTMISYLEWLRRVFLLHEAPAWQRNLAAREMRRPKLFMADTGLAAAQLRLTPEKLDLPNSTATGALLETFVFNEIVRQSSAAQDPVDVYHYNNGHGREVDLVLENYDGALIAIEIKASSSPNTSQLKSVAWLRDRLDELQPGTFCAGYLLHTGHHNFKVDDRLHLRPIPALWTSPAPEQISLT